LTTFTLTPFKFFPLSNLSLWKKARVEFFISVRAAPVCSPSVACSVETPANRLTAELKTLAQYSNTLKIIKIITFPSFRLQQVYFFLQKSKIKICIFGFFLTFEFCSVPKIVGDHSDGGAALATLVGCHHDPPHSTPAARTAARAATEPMSMPLPTTCARQSAQSAQSWSEVGNDLRRLADQLSLDNRVSTKKQNKCLLISPWLL
jgi:hypothetical protein